MINEIPLIAKMIVIDTIIVEENESKRDISYNNPEYDSYCEYCLNTSAWD